MSTTDRSGVRQVPRPQQVVYSRVRAQADVDALERHTPEDQRPADTIHGCLTAVRDIEPTKSALVLAEPPDFFSPAHTLTYADVVAEVEQSANLFHDLAGDASVVGIMLPMVPASLTALWGAATAGIGVPINPFLEQNSLVRLLNETRATTLVTTRDIVARKCGSAQVLRGGIPTLREVLYVDEPASFRAAVEKHAGRGLGFDPDENPDRTAMVMPTGGTTGAPKLVRMSMRGQLTVAWNVGALMGCRRDDVVGHGMPNFHCGGAISLGLRALLFGSTLLTLSTEGFRAPEVVASFWDIARHYGMTSLLATPTTALALLRADGDATGHRIEDFHVGGSALPMELVQSFHDRFGIWLRENWGMTELHGTVTGHFNDGTCPRVGSAGRPLPWYRVRAVELDGNGNYVRDCAPGERGTLLIGGPSVTDGYLFPEHDAEFFAKGVPGRMRWGNTGDLGMIDDDGYVWVFGRAKDVIIRGGHNIDPKEIEDALSRHPDVHVAAAVGRPDVSKGELPIAYVQLREGAALTPSELIAYCREHVQEKAAAPTEILIVDEFPMTPVGKISKPALRADAVEREIHSRLAEVAPATRSEVHLDSSGPRRCVVVVLEEGASAEVVSSVTERLSGYEFASRVEVAEVALGGD